MRRGQGKSNKSRERFQNNLTAIDLRKRYGYYAHDYIFIFILVHIVIVPRFSRLEATTDMMIFKWIVLSFAHLSILSVNLADFYKKKKI